MRDLSKLTVTAELWAKSGFPLARIYKGERGALYAAFVHKFENGQIYYREFRDMRLTALREAAMYVGELLSEDNIDQEAAEKVLELIYFELNRRLENKSKS